VTTVECDRCGADGYTESGEINPDDWHRRDGMNICPRCTIELDAKYLRDHGWEWVKAALDDLPDGGVWADPLGELRHQRLERAVEIQAKRDGYGQLQIEAS